MNEINFANLMVMFEIQDPMKEEICKLKDELFFNIGCAGKKL